MSGRVILFVEHHGEIVGGGQFSLLALMQHLQDYRPHCATGGEGTMTAAVRELGTDVEVVLMPPIRPGRFAAVLSCVWRLRRLARQRGAVLLHANGSRSMFYAGLAAKLLGVPVCWHVRIVEADGWWDRLLAGWATRIVAISNAVAGRFAPLDARSKVRIVHNGVDVETFARGDRAGRRAEWGWGERPVVGIVAQLIAWKRQDVFVAAAALLAERFPQVLFALVGTEPDPAQGYETRLRAQVAALDLADRVVFTGFCNDAPGVFAALDVVVLTSDNEPFGRVLIEAMAAAKPVVATEGGGVPEIVVDGETGLLVPIGNAQATAEAIAALLDDGDKARALGAAGKERARAKFSIEAHAQQVEEVYAEILGGYENRH